jgi:hypothetical protein
MEETYGKNRQCLCVVGSGIWNAKAYWCAEEHNVVCEAECDDVCNRVCDEIYNVNPFSLPGHCPYRRPNTYVQLLLFITGRCLGCSSWQTLYDQVSGLVGQDDYSRKEEKKGWEMAAEDAVKTGGLEKLERNLKDAAEAGYELKDSEYEEMARPQESSDVNVVLNVMACLIRRCLG